MPESAAPYEIVKGLLQGVAAPRPLFLPIVFSHAARIENVPLRTFLRNPTKISNALRQVRARLRSDGVTCYFDPFLESEALGATLEWAADDRPPLLKWPMPGAAEGLEISATAAHIVSGGRVPVAAEVIRRLKTTLRGDSLLMASVTGPLTLTASLSRLDMQNAPNYPDFAEQALDLVTTAITAIATTFLEAGASALLIREEILPTMSDENFADWCSRLAPIVNIVRFYRALPVLLLECRKGVEANRERILRAPWDCILCPVVRAHAHATLLAELGPSSFGLALPPEMLGPGSAADFDAWIKQTVCEVRPAVLTTTGDLPASVDIERLNKLWENLQCP